MIDFFLYFVFIILLFFQQHDDYRFSCLPDTIQEKRCLKNVIIIKINMKMKIQLQPYKINFCLIFEIFKMFLNAKRRNRHCNGAMFQ